MHSANLVVLLAGTAAAQSTVTILNFFQATGSITLKGSDSKATTYGVDCPGGGGVLTPSPSAISGSATTNGASSDTPSTSVADVNLTPITALPTQTRAARLRRQQSTDDGAVCEPYTIIQGASSWEFHLTDPSPGLLTWDANCNWSGELTAVEVTCTATQQGSAPFLSAAPGTTSTVWKTGELSKFDAFQTATVVLPSSTTQTVASSTANSSGASSSTASSNGTLSTSHTSPPKQTGQSSAFAAPGPLPTGAMAFVGGAAGLFVAALAL